MSGQNVSKLDEYFNHVPAEEADNKEVIARLRDWVETQPHLPFVSDRQLSMFLHSCYSNFEQTKTTVEEYFTQRTRSSDIFSNRNTEEIKAYFNVSYVYKDERYLSVDGHQILHIGFVDSDSSKFDIMQSIKMICALLDLYTNLMPYASGWRICVDVKCIGFSHYLKLTSNMNAVRKLICYVTTALPIRLKGIHIRNANSLMCQFINMLKPFLKKEIFEMLNLHSASDENLYKYVQKESIPYQDYDNLSESKDRLLKTSTALLDEYKKWFEDDERLARTDETKRIINKTAKGTSFFRSIIGGNKGGEST